MNESEAQALVGSFVGDFIEGITRIFYVFDDEVNRDAGGIELILRNGSIIHLDSGGDGEALVISKDPWQDGFELATTLEDLEFVRTHGKWTRFDVSREARFRDLIGRSIDAVNLVLTPAGKVVGATFWVASQMLRVEVDADDLYVQLA